MKTTLLFFFALTISVSALAQKFCFTQSNNNDRSVKLEKKPTVDDPVSTLASCFTGYKPVCKSIHSTPAVSETTIGGTTYDLQTNLAVANRIYAYPDGTKAAVWTMGFAAPAYADRGTGYNYFNGTSWGTDPTSRIEPVRTGWPAYCPLGAGELVVAHDFVSGLQVSKRAVRGTGSWTTSFVAAPAGATKVSWPRAVTSGNTIHVIAVSGVAYQGLNLALLYYRSTDGGTSWDVPRILPGLDAASLGAATGKSFSGFNGDSYAFAAPKGDTIAFAVAEPMGGIWIMKSFDNGANWTKTTVFTVPVLTVAPSPVIPSIDGSISVTLDNQGAAHIVVGRMLVSDDDYSVAGNTYYPYTDGLIYWKEGMPQLDTTQLGNLDVLETNGNLIGYMTDYNGNAEIDFPGVGSGQFPFGLYGTSLSSMGQIIIDEYNMIYVTFSSCREDLINLGATPNAQLYRHLYYIEKGNESNIWSNSHDLNDDIIHSYDECVFASLAYSAHSGFGSLLNIVYQVDPEPGTSAGPDADVPGENYITYLTIIPPMSLKPVDISKNVMVSPNPATDFANVLVSLIDSKRVEVSIYNIVGELVMTYNYGQQTTGYHTYKVNTSSLPSGMYLFTVKIGNEVTSRKVVVR